MMKSSTGSFSVTFPDDYISMIWSAVAKNILDICCTSLLLSASTAETVASKTLLAPFRFRSKDATL
jgi:hypothetical protein